MVAGWSTWAFRRLYTQHKRDFIKQQADHVPCVRLFCYSSRVFQYFSILRRSLYAGGPNTIATSRKIIPNSLHPMANTGSQATMLNKRTVRPAEKDTFIRFISTLAF
jgi:hypothetical protein